jgi:uncharacterized membrane protein YkoI
MLSRILGGCLLATGLLSGAQARTPGNLDARSLVNAAAEAVGVSKVKVFTKPDGTVRKLAVYHNDPDRVPAPVKAAAEKAYPKSTVLSYESEIYVDLGEVFEVELKTADGKKVEFAAKPDGTLHYVESEIPEAEVPEQVLATAKALVLGGKFIEAERKQGKDTLEFAVKLEKDGLKHYLHVAPDGTLKRHTLRIPAEFEVEVPAPKR